MSTNQGIYMGGPMSGRIIDLPDPVPARLTVAVNLHRCKHSPEQEVNMTMLEYQVNKPVNEFLPYFITLTSNFDDVGWYCPTCEAEAKVKFKLKEIEYILRGGEDDELG